MNTWFLKIEGKSEANADINYPFGFYVNCLLSTEKGIEDAKQSILSDLRADGYDIVKIEQSGDYKDFFWNDKELQIELAM